MYHNLFLTSACAGSHHRNTSHRPFDSASPPPERLPGECTRRLQAAASQSKSSNTTDVGLVISTSRRCSVSQKDNLIPQWT